jgi:superfamily II DNA/RNA helicase
LAERGFSAACLHGAIPPARRAAEFALFRSHAVDLLICTDAAARGLDFPAASAVVMFDFPRDAVDFVHRAGRVGREGQPAGARCVALVAPHDEARARAIEHAAARRLPIDLGDGSGDERGRDDEDRGGGADDGDGEPDARRRHAPAGFARARKPAATWRERADSRRVARD